VRVCVSVSAREEDLVPQPEVIQWEHPFIEGMINSLYPGFLALQSTTNISVVFPIIAFSQNITVKIYFVFSQNISVKILLRFLKLLHSFVCPRNIQYFDRNIATCIYHTLSNIQYNKYILYNYILYI